MTDILSGNLIEILFGIDEIGQCWMNIARKGWTLNMDLAKEAE